MKITRMEITVTHQTPNPNPIRDALQSLPGAGSVRVTLHTDATHHGATIWGSGRREFRSHWRWPGCSPQRSSSTNSSRWLSGPTQHSSQPPTRRWSARLSTTAPQGWRPSASLRSTQRCGIARKGAGRALLAALGRRAHADPRLCYGGLAQLWPRHPHRHRVDGSRSGVSRGEDQSRRGDSQEDIARVEAVRKAIGDSVDPHGRR